MLGTSLGTCEVQLSSKKATVAAVKMMNMITCSITYTNARGFPAGSNILILGGTSAETISERITFLDGDDKQALAQAIASLIKNK